MTSEEAAGPRCWSARPFRQLDQRTLNVGLVVLNLSTWLYVTAAVADAIS